jgi:hypothetical protein
MKDVIGVIIIVLGIILGLYVGVWFCLIGGIVQTIEAVRANPISSMDVAIGIARIFFSGLAGWCSFFMVWAIGISVLGDK